MADGDRRPSAPGTAVNIAIPAGTNDQGWLRALHAVVPDVLGGLRARQVLVTQHGVDTHFEDPLAHLLVSLDGQRMAFEALHRWAHRYAGGRWVALGGGGYEWVDVVPRAWTHLIAEASRASAWTRSPRSRRPSTSSCWRPSGGRRPGA